MARSRLYRRRFLQVNTHWKAFFEIYKILHTFAPIQSKNLQIFALLCFFSRTSRFCNFLLIFLQILSFFAAIFAEFCRNSVKLQKIAGNLNWI